MKILEARIQARLVTIAKSMEQSDDAAKAFAVKGRSKALAFVQEQLKKHHSGRSLDQSLALSRLTSWARSEILAARQAAKDAKLGKTEPKTELKTEPKKVEPKKVEPKKTKAKK